MTLRQDLPRALDLNELLELVSGDVDLLREVAELGMSDIVRLLDAIADAPTASAMAHLTHELKGVLLNLTAASAARRTADVELAARSGDRGSAWAELVRARPAIDEVVAMLATLAADRQREAS